MISLPTVVNVDKMKRLALLPPLVTHSLLPLPSPPSKQIKVIKFKPNQTREYISHS